MFKTLTSLDTPSSLTEENGYFEVTDKYILDYQDIDIKAIMKKGVEDQKPAGVFLYDGTLPYKSGEQWELLL